MGLEAVGCPAYRGRCVGKGHGFKSQHASERMEPLGHARRPLCARLVAFARSLAEMLGRRSRLHLLLLNSLTCGLEICVAAGITYVPPLLLKGGVEERYMTMVLGIGPVLGLLFIPLIGSASDRCASRFASHRWRRCSRTCTAARRRRAARPSLCSPSCVLITMKVSEEPSRGALLLALERSPPEAARSCAPSRRCRVRLWRPGLPPCFLRTCCSLVPAVYRSYYRVPRVMRRLCAAQLCSWMAVVSFMLFYTDFVGEGLYAGVPSAAPGTVSRQRYEEGIRVGSLGLFLQCATSTVFSLGMSRLVRRFGSRRVYLGGVVSFAACTLVICLSKSVVLVTTMSALTGFAYATLQTLPYALTCHYRKEQERHEPTMRTKNLHGNGVTVAQESAHLDLEGADERHLRKLSAGHKCSCSRLNGCNGPARGSPGADNQVRRGVGLDFAILDSTFLLSQVFPTLFMGMIVQFTESATTYIACSSLVGFVAIYVANHVVFDQKDFEG